MDYLHTLSEVIRAALVDRYALPSVIVSDSGNIVFISGRTGKLLEPAEGDANWSIQAMAREGLRVELPAAIHRAIAHKTDVVLRGLDVKTNGGYQKVNVTISPFTEPVRLVGLLMVTLPFVIRREYDLLLAPALVPASSITTDSKIIPVRIVCFNSA